MKAETIGEFALHLLRTENWHGEVLCVLDRAIYLSLRDHTLMCILGGDTKSTWNISANSSSDSPFGNITAGVLVRKKAGWLIVGHNSLMIQLSQAIVWQLPTVMQVDNNYAKLMQRLARAA